MALDTLRWYQLWRAVYAVVNRLLTPFAREQMDQFDSYVREKPYSQDALQSLEDVASTRISKDLKEPLDRVDRVKVELRDVLPTFDHFESLWQPLQSSSFPTLRKCNSIQIKLSPKIRGSPKHLQELADYQDFRDKVISDLPGILQKRLPSMRYVVNFDANNPLCFSVECLLPVVQEISQHHRRNSPTWDNYPSLTRWAESVDDDRSFLIARLFVSQGYCDKTKWSQADPSFIGNLFCFFTFPLLGETASSIPIIGQTLRDLRNQQLGHLSEAVIATTDFDSSVQILQTVCRQFEDVLRSLQHVQLSEASVTIQEIFDLLRTDISQSDVEAMKAQMQSQEEIALNQDYLFEFYWHLEKARTTFIAGTRPRVMNAILKWESDYNSASNIFWLGGEPGLGKSTLSAHVCRQPNVVAYWFTSASEFSNLPRMIKSLSRLLAKSIPEYRQQLSAINATAVYRNVTDAEALWNCLICSPLWAVNRPMDLVQRKVIVIDALDEFSVSDCQRLLKIVANFRLPDWVGLLFTSRPETKSLLDPSSPLASSCVSRNLMSAEDGASASSVPSADAQEDVADVKAYLTKEVLKSGNEERASEFDALTRDQLLDKLSEDVSLHTVVNLLSDQVGAHFLLAFHLANNTDQSQQRPLHMLEAADIDRLPQHLSEVYVNCMNTAKRQIEADDADDRLNSRLVFLTTLQLARIITAACEPLTIATITAILNRLNPHGDRAMFYQVYSPPPTASRLHVRFAPPRAQDDLPIDDLPTTVSEAQVLLLLERVSSMFTVSSSSVVRPNHKSVRDFFCSMATGPEDVPPPHPYQIDTHLVHLQLAQVCFQTLIAPPVPNLSHNRENSAASSSPPPCDSSSSAALELPMMRVGDWFDSSIDTNPLLRYAVVYGIQHAIYSNDLPSVAAFMCHPQWLHMAAGEPDLLRVAARLCNTIIASTPQAARTAVGAVGPAWTICSNWLATNQAVSECRALLKTVTEFVVAQSYDVELRAHDRAQSHRFYYLYELMLAYPDDHIVCRLARGCVRWLSQLPDCRIRYCRNKRFGAPTGVDTIRRAGTVQLPIHPAYLGIAIDSSPNPAACVMVDPWLKLYRVDLSTGRVLKTSSRDFRPSPHMQFTTHRVIWSIDRSYFAIVVSGLVGADGHFCMQYCLHLRHCDKDLNVTDIALPACVPPEREAPSVYFSEHQSMFIIQQNQLCWLQLVDLTKATLIQSGSRDASVRGVAVYQIDASTARLAQLSKPVDSGYIMQVLEWTRDAASPTLKASLSLPASLRHLLGDDPTRRFQLHLYKQWVVLVLDTQLHVFCYCDATHSVEHCAQFNRHTGDISAFFPFSSLQFSPRGRFVVFRGVDRWYACDLDRVGPAPIRSCGLGHAAHNIADINDDGIALVRTDSAERFYLRPIALDAGDAAPVRNDPSESTVTASGLTQLARSLSLSTDGLGLVVVDNTGSAQAWLMSDISFSRSYLHVFSGRFQHVAFIPNATMSQGQATYRLLVVSNTGFVQHLSLGLQGGQLRVQTLNECLLFNAILPDGAFDATFSPDLRYALIVQKSSTTLYGALIDLNSWTVFPVQLQSPIHPQPDPSLEFEFRVTWPSTDAVVVVHFCPDAVVDETKLVFYCNTVEQLKSTLPFVRSNDSVVKLHGEGISANVAWSHDGQYLAVRQADEIPKVHLYQLQLGHERLHLAVRLVKSVVPDPDGLHEIIDHRFVTDSSGSTTLRVDTESMHDDPGCLVATHYSVHTANVGPVRRSEIGGVMKSDCWRLHSGPYGRNIPTSLFCLWSSSTSVRLPLLWRPQGGDSENVDFVHLRVPFLQHDSASQSILAYSPLKLEDALEPLR